MVPFFLVAMVLSEYMIGSVIALTIMMGTAGWLGSLTTIGWIASMLGGTFVMLLLGVTDDKFGVSYRRAALVVGVALATLATVVILRFQGISIHIEIPPLQ